MKCETHMLQDRTEMQRFIRLIQKNKVESYLEIGSKNGGSLWTIGNTLPKGARIISVDLPHGDHSFKNTLPNLRECVDALCKRGYDAQLFVGDSTDQTIVDQVKALGPYDLVFIDANHTVPYIWKDWQNYGPLCRLVAFHDISFSRPGGMAPGKKPVEVPQVWNEIKKDYEFVEIRNCPMDNGIGILARAGALAN